jgi:hypothetical protein
MKRVITGTLLLALIALFPFTAAQAAQVLSAVVSIKVDEEMIPMGVSSSFPSDTGEIHAVVLLNSGEAGSIVKATWVAVDAVETPEAPIDSAEVKLPEDGFNRLHFSLALSEGVWPSGHYRLDIEEGGQVIGRASFTFIPRERSQDAPPFASVALFESMDEATGKLDGVSDIFTADTRSVNALLVVEEGKTGEKLTGRWVGVNSFEEPNQVMLTEEATLEEDGRGAYRFGVTWSEGNWPSGTYRLDILAGDEVLASIPWFIIEAAEPGPFEGFNLGPPKPDKDRDWTMMVYMDGDNNLEPFALRDMDEMERAIPTKGMEVVVLIDRADGFTQQEGDWKDARVYRVTPNRDEGVGSTLIASPGEVNMGDPAVLEGFVSSAMKAFPAKRYALILWDHGGGWITHVTDDDAPGSPGNFDKLDLPELRTALEGALEGTGVEKLDIVGFDMCLMAQLETAFEIGDIARYMVGSQATEPGDGWPYESVLPLFTKPTSSAKEVARGIVKVYGDFYIPAGEPIATQSAFDLSVVRQVAGSLDSWLAVIEGQLQKSWQSLTRALFFAEGYGDIADMRRGPGALLSIDLGDLLNNINAAVPDLGKSKESKTLREALGRFVIETVSSHRHSRSQGVAIYAPFRTNLLNDAYGATRFAEASRWYSTLKSLHQVQGENPSKPQLGKVRTVSILRNKPVGEIIQMGQDGFSFEYEGNNILWLHALIGQKAPKSGDTYIYEKQLIIPEPEDPTGEGPNADIRQILTSSSYPDGRHTMEIPYDGTQRLVSNGEEAFPVTIDASDIGDLENRLISIPALFRHSDYGELFATIYFNALWRSAGVTLEVPQKDGSYTYMSIKPPPDSEIDPLLETIEKSGERSYTKAGTFQWKDGLTLLLDPVPAGDYQAFLSLESLTGFSSMVGHSFPVQERDDDLLKGLIPEDYLPDNFIGEWDAIDSDAWFRSGKKTPLGSGMRIEAHPKFDGLLKMTYFDTQGQDIFPGMERVAIIHTGPGLPHTRELFLNAEGVPVPNTGIETVLDIFDHDRRDGQYLLLAFNMSQNLQYVFVKRSGPTPKLKDVSAPQPAAPGQPAQPSSPFAPVPGASPLAGSWQSMDGSAVVFQGNQWAYYEMGQQVDGGVFQLQGSQLTTQSTATGQVVYYTVQLMGDQLVLADNFGQYYQFNRMR